jgi:hypothetical protein
MSLKDFLRGKPQAMVSYEEPSGQANQAPATITGITVFVRPDLLLQGGKLLPGVPIEVASSMLAAQLRRLIQADNVPVDVRPLEYMGRFARIEYTIPDWEAPVVNCLLAGTADKSVYAAWMQYQDGWTQKVSQLHRRTQDVSLANKLLEKAEDMWKELRDSPRRVVGEGEYAFMLGSIDQALTMQELVPTPRQGRQVFVDKAADPGLPCPKCQSEQPVINKFCTACGASLPAA